ncbi:MAG: PKD domain-containing protein [Bacteroidota bacterium]
MKTRFLLLLFILSFAKLSWAIRPTLQPTNFKITATTCQSLQLSWTNGNGNARVIVAREGNAPNFTPQDNTAYTPDKNFGKSTAYNGDNYIVFNTAGINFVTIDSLKQGATYYFTIYEHDNAGASTLYDTIAAPSTNGSTYFIDPNFTITAFDSCQAKNNFKFSNLTVTNITSTLNYQWDFGDGSPYVSNAFNINHSYTISGIILPRLIINSNIAGCPTGIKKSVRVYRNKNVVIDYANFNDTVQCFTGNLFMGNTTPLTNPLSVTYRYNWVHGDGTYSTFSYLKKSYAQSGIYNVSLIVNTFTFKGDSLGCNDTLSMQLTVLANLLANVDIPVRQHVLKNNNFTFNNNDSLARTGKWYFGDGDSSIYWRNTHTYKDTGLYIATQIVYDSATGCYGSDTFHIRVEQEPPSNINKIQANLFRLFPNPANELLTVQSNGIQSLKIIDVNGRMLKSFVIDNNITTLQIDLSDFGTGLYVVEITTDSGTGRQLLQIQH